MNIEPIRKVMATDESMVMVVLKGYDVLPLINVKFPN